MKGIITFFTTCIIILGPMGLQAQLTINKSVDQNFVFVSPIQQEPLNFTIEVTNNGLCPIIYEMVDDMRDSFSFNQPYAPIINNLSSTEGVYTFDANTSVVTWNDTIPPGETATLIISTFLEFPWGGYDTPFTYTNTANITYTNDCCNQILQDNDPDNDILCQCADILSDTDILNDSLCTNDCDSILTDTIMENDYLCVATLSNGPFTGSASVNVNIEFCEFCDPFFAYFVDGNGMLSTTSNAWFGDWYIDNQYISSGITLQHQFTTSGIYELCYYALDNCGFYQCSECQQITVCVQDVTIDATHIIADCNAPTIGLTAIPNLPPATPNDYTYQWSNGTIGEFNFTLPTGPETHTVTVTDIYGCSAEATIQVDADFSVPNAFLNYPTTELTNTVTSITLEVIGTGNLTYNWWQQNNSTSTLVVTEPGTYTVYVGDLDNGCGTQFSVTITEDLGCTPTFPCDASFTPNISYNTDGTATVSLTANYDFGYIEVNGQVVATSNYPFDLNPGTYNLCYFAFDDCSNICSECESITISPPCALNTFIEASSPIASCDNPTIALTAISNPPPNNPGDYSYIWSDGSNGESIPALITAPEVFSVTVTDLNGCTSEASISLDADFSIPNVILDYPTTELTNTTTSIPLEVIGMGNYTYNWWQQNNSTSTLVVTEPGTYTVYVGNLDNGCGTQLSVTITENIVDTCHYELGQLELSCQAMGDNSFCLPLMTKGDITNGMIGMDYCLVYDPSLMAPTGFADLGSVVLDSDPNATYAINANSFPNMVCLTIYYTSAAPVGTSFTGSGEIACIEFEPLASFYGPNPLNAEFSIDNLIESYEIDIVQGCADDGWASNTGSNSMLQSQVTFWDDTARPLKYDTDNPSTYNLTQIGGTDSNCWPNQSNLTQPDLNGSFYFNTVDDSHIQLERDIDNNVQVMPIINGMDCYWTHLVTTLDPLFSPSPYQMIAMDVNMNGSVTAGDITHIQNRITLNIGEYPQLWNENTIDASKDWLFVDNHTVDNTNQYQISSTYPFDDGSGFHRLNIPQTSFCYEIPITNDGTCSYPSPTDFRGILLGDTDGSWDNSAAALRLDEEPIVSMNIDESVIIEEECSILIPIYVNDQEWVKAIDFVMDYNSAKLSFDGYTHGSPSNDDIGMAYNQIDNGDILFTSYSKWEEGIQAPNTVFFYAKFSILNEDENIFPSDFIFKHSYVDGRISNHTVMGSEVSCKLDTEEENYFAIYPNPFEDEFTVETRGFPQGTTFSLFFYDVAGKLIESRQFQDEMYYYQKEGLPKGVYLYELKIGKERVGSGRLIAQ